MTRAEVYAKIKEYELQVEIKNKYGFNYTNLSTATLASVVADYEAFKKIMHNHFGVSCCA